MLHGLKQVENGSKDILEHQLGIGPPVLLCVAPAMNDSHLLDESTLPALPCACRRTWKVFSVRYHALLLSPFHQQEPGASSEPIQTQVLHHWIRFMFRFTGAAAPIPNKPKQTINNGGRFVAIDVHVHGFANLNRHPNTANPTCSCLAAFSNMEVQSRLVGHGNPY